MKYLLFGSDTAYSEMEGGALDYLGTFDTLELAQFAGLRRALSDGHVASFDGSDMRIVSYLTWREAPVANREAKIAEQQREYEKRTATALAATANPQSWYFGPFRPSFPAEAVWMPSQP